ncbi:MAG: DUF4040 domain-containing protein [Acidimicrobiia bacterium]|nr:DUF4040 domain-containing protein [Acidimicrobiia bacterium]
MTFVLIVHLAAIAASLILGRRLGRKVLLLGALAPLSALVWALTISSDVLGGNPLVISLEWVEGLDLGLDFRVDAFALLMVTIISAIGVLVFVYGARYFRPRSDLGGFDATLIGFAGAMVGLVIADNVLVLFVFWELTSITSYLLIGFEDRSATARAAALRALLVTGLGGLAMMAGLVMIAQEADSYLLSEILASAPTSTKTVAGLLLVLVGAFSKSAQFPFHFWLPGAMAAPTPVSAYLHSATMVKAGVYLIARLAPVFGPLIAVWRPTIMAVGVMTMILGGWRALGEKDLKLVLAMGTVSQLGFLTVLVGFGHPALTFAGVILLLAHAMFKAALFMVVGILDRQTGTRQIGELDGWGRRMPMLWWVAMITGASMAGVPPLLGFLGKEEALRGLLEAPDATPAFIGVIVGSIVTVAYTLHFFKGSRSGDQTEAVTSAPRLSLSVVAPTLLLAILTLLAGVAPFFVDGLLGGASQSLDSATADSHLALWHGLEPALGWSLLILGAGAFVWWAPTDKIRPVTSQIPEATQIYSGVLRYVNRIADLVTSVVQSGSLPVYLQIILATAVIIPGFSIVRYWAPDLGQELVDTPLRIVVVVVMALAAIGVSVARRRIGAVLFLGAIGYGVAVLFVLHGAPDLALTQLLVETLSLAMFVMVLRHLPERWQVVRWKMGQTNRLVISVAVALMMGGLALWAAESRVAPSLSDDYVELAQPEGGGRNVVNVILTDFRGFDTMGEITVITLAAIGCIVLLGRTRRRSVKEEES